MFGLFTSLVVGWAYNHWCVGDQSDFGNVEADQCTNDCVEIHRKKLNATPESRAEVDKEYVLEEEGADDYRDDHSAGHYVEDKSQNWLYSLDVIGMSRNATLWIRDTMHYINIPERSIVMH